MKYTIFVGNFAEKFLQYKILDKEELKEILKNALDNY